MKNRYDGRPGVQAGQLKQRSAMYQSEHAEKNAFVKKQEAMTASMGMKKEVGLDAKYMRFDQCMINDGEHAQSFARTLTGGLDKKAFPVK